MPKDGFKGLQKKYGLPTYDDLDHEFEIASIDSKDHLLRAIRRKIEERLDHYAKVLEELLQGETTFANLHECQDLDEKKKEEIYNLYRELMGRVRSSMGIAIDNDEEETAGFIKESHRFWQKEKGRLRSILKDMGASWGKKSSLSERHEYLG